MLSFFKTTRNKSVFVENRLSVLWLCPKISICRFPLRCCLEQFLPRFASSEVLEGSQSTNHKDEGDNEILDQLVQKFHVFHGISTLPHFNQGCVSKQIKLFVLRKLQKNVYNTKKLHDPNYNFLKYI